MEYGFLTHFAKNANFIIARAGAICTAAKSGAEVA